MKRTNGIFALALLIGSAGALSWTTPAAAQHLSESYTFLKAVRDRDGNKASDMLNVPGTRIMNTRDANGTTALHIVAARRDLVWTKFLLAKGASPDVLDRQGMSPLMQAAQLGWTEGVQALLDGRARPDFTNQRGETALIIATQLRQGAIVRLLLDKGANPDLTDSVTGQSAREYATRDPRASAILAEIRTPRTRPSAPTTAPVAGPK